ncbi:MAG: DNA cytosine methyltransferase [Gammaproteobacteria bacterium]|nr:DNA cytosine methyltransferase [Gammaproteobacteria bacterium]
MRPIGIDLFSGAGGLSLGFEQAGFDIAAAVEIDPIHCAAHKFNFPNTSIIPSSVENVTGDEIRAIAKIGQKRVDCVFGGAPCQGFSLIGQRVLDDPRNNLVKEFVRIVSELEARYFVFENVKGLTVGRHKVLLDEIVEAFENMGYTVRTPWKVLNAAHFGTPQYRERLILFGARKGEDLPDYPEPLTNISGRPQLFPDLPFGPTCSEALSDLPNAELFEELRNSDQLQDVKLDEPSSYAAELRCKSRKNWYFSYVRKWKPEILTSSARTDHTDISRNRFSETEPGSVEPISRFFKLPPDGVSNTLRAGTDGSRGAFTSPRPLHYAYPRCITVREMARLHGFPDWFRFHVTKWHGARQIGNAVPPPLSRAVADMVIKSLGIDMVRPCSKVKLGGEKLLTMDMTNSAKFFDIKAPSNRRNKKSGSKKRKQVDIERERLASTKDKVYA